MFPRNCTGANCTRYSTTAGCMPPTQRAARARRLHHPRRRRAQPDHPASRRWRAGGLPERLRAPWGQGLRRAPGQQPAFHLSLPWLDLRQPRQPDRPAGQGRLPTRRAMPSGAVPDTGETRGLPQLPVHPLRRPASVPETYLGQAKDYIDLICDQSEAELEIIPGGFEHSIKANWKLLAENGVDAYHLPFAHKRYLEYLNTLGTDPESHKRHGRGEALGNGHALIISGPPSTGRPIAYWSPLFPEALAVHRRQVRTPGGTLRAGAGGGHRPHQQKPVHLSQPGDQRHPRPEHPLVLPDRRR